MKKGFTLVELLAVVVILAVLMLVATTAVGPAITNSKKSAFFSSCSSMVDAANIYASSAGITTTCFITSDSLVSKGYFSVKDVSFKGAVLITVSGNSYTYSLVATNGDYSVGTNSSGAYTNAKALTAIRDASGNFTLGNKYTWTAPTKVNTVTTACA